MQKYDVLTSYNQDVKINIVSQNHIYFVWDIKYDVPTYLSL